MPSKIVQHGESEHVALPPLPSIAVTHRCVQIKHNHPLELEEMHLLFSSFPEVEVFVTHLDATYKEGERYRYAHAMVMTHKIDFGMLERINSLPKWGVSDWVWGGESDFRYFTIRPTDNK